LYQVSLYQHPPGEEPFLTALFLYVKKIKTNPLFAKINLHMASFLGFKNNWNQDFINDFLNNLDIQ